MTADSTHSRSCSLVGTERARKGVSVADNDFGSRDDETNDVKVISHDSECARHGRSAQLEMSRPLVRRLGWREHKARESVSVDDCGRASSKRVQSQP